MGSRANYVLVRDGKIGIGRDRRSQKVELDVYGGPSATIAKLEEIIANTDQNDPWYDEDACQGAILVDVDRRVLRFFGGVDLACEIPLRRVYLEDLVARWAGWSVHWALDGLIEITRHIGVADSVVASRYVTEPRRAVVITRRYAPVIASVRWEDDDVGVYALGPVLHELIMYGADNVLEPLRAFDRESGRSRRLEVRDLAHTAPERIERDEVSRVIIHRSLPRQGLHVDVNDRRLFTWSAHLGRLDASSWSGWTHESLGDRFEAHAERASGAIVFPSPEELRAFGLQLFDEWREGLRSSTDPSG